MRRMKMKQPLSNAVVLPASQFQPSIDRHALVARWRVFGVTFIGAVILLASADAAFADLVWRNGRWVDERSLQANMNPQAALALSRFLAIGAATGLGFAIGWFVSPQGREARMALLLVLGLIAVGAVAFNDGLFGLSAMTLLSLIGFAWGIGYWLGQVMSGLMEPPTTFGSATWANAAHLAEKGMFQTEKGLLLGSAFNGVEWDKISYDGDRHLFTYAPTRSGKGVSHVLPNLLVYDGSVLVIDPKGENAIITAKARAAMGQKILAIDPWGIAVDQIGIKAARFNPLDWIRLDDPDATENAMLLADALVQKSKNSDPFWQEEAKALLQGFILLVAFDETYDGRRNLGTVRDLLLLGEKEMTALFTYMADSMHPLIASTGSRCLQKEAKLMSNVMTTAQAETHMLDSLRLREALSTSDFDFVDLKKKPMSVFLILPADRLEAFSRFLRLMVQQAITVNARNIVDKPAKPVLFILDEMPALGRLTMVEQAYGLMAGFGIQLWGIAQDLCQMRRVYGDDYETFIANSGAVMYFGSPDKTSTEYFSAMCGVTTVWNFSTAVATAFSRTVGQNGSSSESTTSTDNRAATQRKLAYPDELRRLPKDLQLILVEDTNPIMARKIRWYEDPALSAKGVNTHNAD